MSTNDYWARLIQDPITRLKPSASSLSVDHYDHHCRTLHEDGDDDDDGTLYKQDNPDIESLDKTPFDDYITITIPPPPMAGLADPQRPRPPEFVLEVFADLSSVKDIVKGVLHTIFFHRYFPPLRPSLRDLPSLDITLPFISDPPDLETMIDARTASLMSQLSSSNSPNGGVRGQIAVQFFEKRRRAGASRAGGGGVTGGWFGLGGGGGGAGVDEEVCWEAWRVEVTIATPRTESERMKVRKAMETSVQKTAMKIVNIVNKHRDHIPPITTSDSNPFPYQIIVNPKQAESWGNRFGNWA